MPCLPVIGGLCTPTLLDIDHWILLQPLQRRMGHLRTRMGFFCCVRVCVLSVQQRVSIDRKHIPRDSVPFRQYDWGFESHPIQPRYWPQYIIRNGDFWIPRSDGSAKLKKPKSKPGTLEPSTPSGSSCRLFQWGTQKSTIVYDNIIIFPLAFRVIS